MYVLSQGVCLEDFEDLECTAFLLVYVIKKDPLRRSNNLKRRIKSMSKKSENRHSGLRNAKQRFEIIFHVNDMSYILFFLLHKDPI